MVGHALKKIAKENNMKIDNGVAYGVYKGYTVTLSEGNGYKLIGIATKAPDEEKVDALLNELNAVNLEKTYRVIDLNVSMDGIIIEFRDNPGTMKCFNNFVEWFFPLLGKYGFLGSNYCSRCGQLLDSQAVWVCFEGFAVHMHAGCAAAEEQEMVREVEAVQEKNTGSYGAGFVGALLGALVGAIPWAIILYIGYVAAPAGLLIGFLALKGYDMFHGKMGKGKVVIVALTSLLGAAAGNLLCDVATLAVMIQNGEIYGALMSDIPAILQGLWQDAEYVRSFIAGLVEGSIFALLGIFGILYNLHKNDPTKMPKIKRMK